MRKLFAAFILEIAFISNGFGQCSNSLSPLSQSVNCTAPNASFTVSAINPTTNVRHDWYSPNNPLPNGVAVLSSTNVVSVLSGAYSAGVYTVITTDLGNLCQSSQTFAITSPSATPIFSMSAFPDFNIGCTPFVTLSLVNPISTQTPPSTCSYTFLPPTFTGVITPSVVLGAGGSTVTNVTGTWTIVAQDNSNFCRAFLPVPIGTSSVQPSFSHTVGAAGLVFFQSTSTGTNGGTTYSWDFGDGTTGTGINTSHTYSNGGIHQVILSTSNPNCNTASNPVNVTTLPCTANSGFSVAYSGTPQVWNASPNYFGNVTNAIWYWGDGSSDNAMFPTHTYSAAGFYNICLSLTVSCANTSSFCSNYNIYKGMEVDESMQMVTLNVIPKLPTGIEKNEWPFDFISVYPNPSTGSEIIIQNFSSEKGHIIIQDINGREIISGKLFLKENIIVISQPGIYFANFQIGNAVFRKKLIVLK